MKKERGRNEEFVLVITCVRLTARGDPARRKRARFDKGQISKDQER